MKCKTKLVVSFVASFLACSPIYSNVISASNIVSSTNYANDTVGLYEEVKDGVVMIANILDDSMGAGTGMIYKEDEKNLYIITNYHVVKDGVKYYCDFNSSERKEASLLGYDDYFDVAVLVCEKPNTYKVLKYANSNLVKEGEEIVAIGNPSSPDLKYTTTKGVVANTRIIMSNENFYLDRHLIMADLALNPGNSGGPSFNVYGHVVGINAVKYTSNGITNYEGMNFMIPISDALNVVKRIEQHKYHVFVRPFIGDLKLFDIGHLYYYEKVKYNIPLTQNDGVIIDELSSSRNNPLIDAGLKEGCIITKLAGKKVKDQIALRNILYSLNIYQKVDIEYMDINDNFNIKISKVAINAFVTV